MFFLSVVALATGALTPDLDYIYRLPFPKGIPSKVLQGAGENFTHRGKLAYAVDFKLDEGTPVLAARTGRVVRVVDEFTAGGTDRKFVGRANVIEIAHDDGTVASYQHLRRGGMKVKVGDSVKIGTVIGHSGNTGFTAQPHLHFHVHQPSGKSGYQTLPLKFKTSEGDAIVPVKHQTYTAVD